MGNLNVRLTQDQFNELMNWPESKEIQAWVRENKPTDGDLRFAFEIYRRQVIPLALYNGWPTILSSTSPPRKPDERRREHRLPKFELARYRVKFTFDHLFPRGSQIDRGNSALMAYWPESQVLIHC
jgi:hypothetical protein